MNALWTGIIIAFIMNTEVVIATADDNRTSSDTEATRKTLLPSAGQIYTVGI